MFSDKLSPLSAAPPSFSYQAVKQAVAHSPSPNFFTIVFKNMFPMNNSQIIHVYDMVNQELTGPNGSVNQTRLNPYLLGMWECDQGPLMRTITCPYPTAKYNSALMVSIDLHEVATDFAGVSPVATSNSYHVVVNEGSALQPITGVSPMNSISESEMSSLGSLTFSVELHSVVSSEFLLHLFSEDADTGEWSLEMSLNASTVTPNWDPSPVPGVLQGALNFSVMLPDLPQPLQPGLLYHLTSDDPLVVSAGGAGTPAGYLCGEGETEGCVTWKFIMGTFPTVANCRSKSTSWVRVDPTLGKTPLVRIPARDTEFDLFIEDTSSFYANAMCSFSNGEAVPCDEKMQHVSFSLPYGETHSVQVNATQFLQSNTSFEFNVRRMFGDTITDLKVVAGITEHFSDTVGGVYTVSVANRTERLSISGKEKHITLQLTPRQRQQKWSVLNIPDGRERSGVGSAWIQFAIPFLRGEFSVTVVCTGEDGYRSSFIELEFNILHPFAELNVETLFSSLGGLTSKKQSGDSTSYRLSEVLRPSEQKAVTPMFSGVASFVDSEGTTYPLSNGTAFVLPVSEGYGNTWHLHVTSEDGLTNHAYVIRYDALRPPQISIGGPRTVYMNGTEYAFPINFEAYGSFKVALKFGAETVLQYQSEADNSGEANRLWFNTTFSTTRYETGLFVATITYPEDYGSASAEMELNVIDNRARLLSIVFNSTQGEKVITPSPLNDLYAYFPFGVSTVEAKYVVADTNVQLLLSGSGSNVTHSSWQPISDETSLIPLTLGLNEFRVDTLAEDGVASNTYKLRIYRGCVDCKCPAGTVGNGVFCVRPLIRCDQTVTNEMGGAIQCDVKISQGMYLLCICLYS